MTLSELLHSLTFHEIATYLPKYDYRPLAFFKMHFDILRHTEPHLEEIDEHTRQRWEAIGVQPHEIAIAYIDPEDTLTQGNRLGLIGRTKSTACTDSAEAEAKPLKLIARPLVSVAWHSSLAKELKIAPEVEATPAEIAACCRAGPACWQFSYGEPLAWVVAQEAGFSYTKSFRQKAKFLRSLYAQLVPHKKELMMVKAFRKRLHINSPIFRAMSKRYRNRYRRRSVRFCSNHEYNRQISQVGTFVHKLLTQGEFLDATPDESMLQTLFRVGFYKVYAHRTYAYNAAHRAAYYQELIERYNLFASLPLLCELRDVVFTHCMIVLSTSAAHPLRMEELSLIPVIAGGRKVSFFLKQDDTLGEELGVDIIFYMH